MVMGAEGSGQCRPGGGPASLGLCLAAHSQGHRLVHGPPAGLGPTPASPALCGPTREPSGGGAALALATPAAPGRQPLWPALPARGDSPLLSWGCRAGQRAGHTVTLGPGQGGCTGVRRPESRPRAARPLVGPRLLVPAAAWPHAARGPGASQRGSRLWQEPRWAPSCWARCQPLRHCHLPAAGARQAPDTTSLVPARRPVETLPSVWARVDAHAQCSPQVPLLCAPARGTPPLHPRLSLRQTELCLQRPPGPGSSRRARQLGLAPRGARLGPLGTRPRQWSCPRCPAPGARLGVPCGPVHPVGVGGPPPALARACLHCQAVPPCAPRAGSVTSASPLTLRSAQGPRAHAHPRGRGAAPGPAAGHPRHPPGRHPRVSVARARGRGPCRAAPGPCGQRLQPPCSQA